MENKTERKAWLNWSEKEHKWNLRLWIEDSWEFSKSWKVKDEDDNSGFSWVNDSVLCEIAHLQELGYIVRVTV